MTRLVVTRRWLTDAASEGTVEIPERSFRCYSIEDRSRGLRADMPLEEIERLKVHGVTAIPVGEYELIFCPLRDKSIHWDRKSAHGPEVLHLDGVLGFTHAHIHPANSAVELLGCIAPGLDRTRPDDNWVGRSRLANEALRAVVVPALRLERVFVSVREAPELDARSWQ